MSAEVIRGEVLYDFCRQAENQLMPCCRAALRVVEHFGGQIYGYRCDKNPAAVVGRSAGGHDFAIVGGRWLVDAWAWNFEGTIPVPVFDLADKEQRAWVRAWYGPRKHWERVNIAGLREALAREDAAREASMRRLWRTWGTA